MQAGLTLVGYLWSLLSLIATVAVCTGFYAPYWIRGDLLFRKDGGDGDQRVAAHFGCFRRCTYPLKSPNHVAKFSESCGRFTDFGDIPSVWWQVCTVTVGVGCALSALIGFVSLPAWCAGDIVTRTSGRVLGVFQFIAALLICIGCVLYPLGWDNKQMKEACGETVGPYMRGNCEIGWSFCVEVGGAGLLFLCSFLTPFAGQPIHWRRIKTNALDRPVVV